MEKSKLGISVRSLNTILYFLVATGNILIVMLASGYVLLFENSEKLKKTAVRVLIIVIVFSLSAALLTQMVLISIQFISAVMTNNIDINNALDSYNTNNFIQVFSHVLNGLNNVIRLVIIIIPIIMGIKAYNEKD